jgi:hypothetical protein
MTVLGRIHIEATSKKQQAIRDGCLLQKQRALQREAGVLTGTVVISLLKFVSFSDRRYMSKATFLLHRWAIHIAYCYRGVCFQWLIASSYVQRIDGGRVLDASASAHLLPRDLVSQSAWKSWCVKYSVASSVKQTIYIVEPRWSEISVNPNSMQEIVIRKIFIYKDENWQNTIPYTFISCPFFYKICYFLLIKCWTTRRSCIVPPALHKIHICKRGFSVLLYIEQARSNASNPSVCEITSVVASSK